MPDAMLDQFRNATPEEYAPVIALEPEPLRLMDRREAGPLHCTMSVMQHGPDRLTLTIDTINFGEGSGSTNMLAHIDRATLDAWAELLIRASEDAARPEVR
jgi:hypothetical protein